MKNRRAVAVFLAANQALYETVFQASPDLADKFLDKFQENVEALFAGDEFDTTNGYQLSLADGNEAANDADCLLEKLDVKNTYNEQPKVEA